MLNNNDYKRLLDLMAGCVGIRDRNSRYVYVNQSVATLTGFSHPEEMIGITDHSLKCDVAERADDFIALDQEVMATGKQIQVICINRYADNQEKMLVGTFRPWVDAANKCQGVLIQSELIQLTVISQMFIEMNKYFLSKSPSILQIKENYNDNLLSKRENECLFYLLRGKSSREIAHTLVRSKRTIEHHLENIKAKLGCSSRSEVVDKATELGYHLVVPQEILFNLKINS